METPPAPSRRIAKRLAIREAVASKDPALARLPIVSYEKVGGAEFAAGNLASAFAYFRKAMAMREQWLQAEPQSAEVAQRLAEMAGRLCTGLILLGDMPGALANCHRAGALTTTLLEAHPTDLAVRRQMAVNTIALGNAQRLSGQPKEAASTLQTAIEQFQPLMAQRCHERRPSATDGHRLRLSGEREAGPARSDSGHG